MLERCEHVRALVSAERDRALSQFEQALLDAHLAHCAACRSFRAALVRITHELRSAPAERLESPVEIRRPRRRVSLRLAPAAAALAIVAVGLGSVVTSLNLRDARGGSPGASGSRVTSADDVRGLNNLMRLHARVARREATTFVRENTLGGPVMGPLPPLTGNRP